MKKRHQEFHSTVASARVCVAQEIRGFLKSDRAGKRRLLPRIEGLVVGLYYCGGMGSNQFMRMVCNLSALAYPKDPTL